MKQSLNNASEAQESDGLPISITDEQIDKIASRVVDILEQRQNICSARHAGKNGIYFSGGLCYSEELFNSPEKKPFFNIDSETLYIPFDGGWLYSRQSPDINYPGIFVGVIYDDFNIEGHGNTPFESEVALIEAVIDEDVKIKPANISTVRGDIRTFVYDYVDKGQGIDAPDLGGYTRRKDIENYYYPEEEE